MLGPFWKFSIIQGGCIKQKEDDIIKFIKKLFKKGSK